MFDVDTEGLAGPQDLLLSASWQLKIMCRWVAPSCAQTLIVGSRLNLEIDKRSGTGGSGILTRLGHNTGCMGLSDLEVWFRTKYSWGQL